MVNSSDIRRSIRAFFYLFYHSSITYAPTPNVDMSAPARLTFLQIFLTLPPSLRSPRAHVRSTRTLHSADGNEGSAREEKPLTQRTQNPTRLPTFASVSE